MNYAETILPEFDREMANTRKVLERVPENKLDWQAHPKSHTIGWNANHLAEISGWVEGMLTAASWDFAPVGGAYRFQKEIPGSKLVLISDAGRASFRPSATVRRDGSSRHGQASSSSICWTRAWRSRPSTCFTLR